MSRRHLAFVIGLNAIISLAITIVVIWLVELRRPDPEQLAALVTAAPQIVLASTPLPTNGNVGADAALPTSTTEPLSQINGEIYVVRQGDILSEIATRFNVSIDSLLEANSLDNPDFVFVGQRLFLPAGASETSNSSGDSSTVTGPANETTTIANATTSQAIQITQIQGVGTLEQEAVQIVNESDLALNLQGWTIGHEGGSVYTFGNFPIFPGGSVRVHSRTGTDTSIDLYWGQSEAVWQSQRNVRLVNSQGQLVHEYAVP